MSESETVRASATSDSEIYNASFYGILNAYGDFWTPLAFESEDAARSHIAYFWRNDDAKRGECLRKFKIVPVRVQLTALTGAK